MRFSRPTQRALLWAVPVAVILFLAALGFGNAVDVGPPAGLTGISVTAEGDYVINAYICRDKVDTIMIDRDRQGLKETEENPVVQTYKFTRPMTGLLTLNLSRPQEGWAPGTPTTFESGKGYIVSGEGSAGYDNETSQLNIDADALDALDPGAVYVSNDNLGTKLTPYTPKQFADDAKKACA